MRPLFHPQLVNDPFGDPLLYVDYLYERRALLLDLGDIQALPARKILRLSHIFVSHTHMDHFIGLDRVVRICLGRGHRIALYGPPGFIDQLEHRLAGYTWNLVEGYETDFTLAAVEVPPSGPARRAQFRCRARFRREDAEPVALAGGVLLDEETFRVRAAVLDHRIPCLAFALEEKQHLNIWKNRLDELGLPTGPWLKELKGAIRRGEPDGRPFAVRWRDRHGAHERVLPLGRLRQEVVRIVPGQKIAYVVDAVYHPENAERIVALVRDADLLFIETVFLEQDADQAARKYHLTARQAGELARRAGAKRLIPMHFSARYTGAAERLRREAEAAYAGRP